MDDDPDYGIPATLEGERVSPAPALGALEAD